jgi:glycosyltransferase involved in cell wall biosynthesis
VIVLPIMVDCDEYRSDEQPARSPRIVTYVGTLNERKDGVATLMMAFAHVAAEFSDVNLRLVGDAHDARTSNIPEFLAVAEGLGIAGRVEFTGQVPHSQVARHLRESSLLVLARPSSQQADAGFPTKLGEYLASGRPTIVTRTSDIEEYLSDGVDAYLVPPGDVDALEGALRRALADPDGAAAVGAAGRLVAEERFDYRSSGRVLAETVSRLRGARR